VASRQDAFVKNHPRTIGHPRLAIDRLIVESPAEFRNYIPVLILGLLYLLGCSEDVVRPERTDLPFSLYGILNPTEDRQAIVVFPVQHSLSPLGQEPLDAVVRSTDLETGEVRVWSDSLISDGESGYGHVFWSDFRPAFARAYRIEAIRSDGATSYATVVSAR
jgi:hypothetical protein